MLSIKATKQPTVAPLTAVAPARAAGHRSRRVLLAEDNVVNQAVVAAIMRTHGHSIVTVDNGAQAVAAVLQSAFDVVLMDVQMPEMDGFEATAAIRHSEAGSDRHIPIIALTAHAMKGDRDKCLASGMDAYLSKPVHPRELLAAIDELVADGDSAPVVVESVEPTEHERALDGVGVMDRIEGDVELLRELVALFNAEAVRTCAQLHTALDAGDARRVERLAHALKGSASNLGGVTVARIAQTLEAMGRDNLLTGGTARLAQLDREIERLNRELASLTSREAA
jgi:CheY-like chemotaxis protein/HPt (histidine-containing phosphotransfer) domain-containing protein